MYSVYPHPHMYMPLDPVHSYLTQTLALSTRLLNPRPVHSPPQPMPYPLAS